MAEDINRSGMVYQKDGTIYLISEVLFERDDSISMSKVSETFPADVDPASLGQGIRTALAAFEVRKDRTGWDHNGLDASLAGGHEKISEFRSGLGIVRVRELRHLSVLRLRAEQSADNRGIALSVDLNESCDDAALGAEALSQLKLSLEANAPRKPKPKSLAPKGAASKGLAAALDALGFFSCAEDPEALRDRVRKEGWAGVITGDSYRLFHADAEDLAESGVATFTAALEPFFAAMNVAAPEAKDEVGDSSYSVSIDGDTFPILYPADFRRDEKEPGFLWGIAAYRTVHALNAVLQQRGLAERIYAVEGGNDLFFLLITPTMHQAITAAPGYDRRRGPYLLSETYPAFGQPE